MYQVLIMNHEGRTVAFGKTRARNVAHAVTTIAQHHRLLDVKTAVEIQKTPNQWSVVLNELGLAALVA